MSVSILSSIVVLGIFSSSLCVAEDSSKMSQPKHVQKRAREFVGKRSSLSEPGLESYLFGNHQDQPHFLFQDPLEPYSDGAVSERGKRPRQFVGKRGFEKRPRQFVGKRDHLLQKVMEAYAENLGAKNDRMKRVREFIGKRSFDGYSMDKRPRQFVGKRDSLYRDIMAAYADEMDANQRSSKRAREFVGKRNFDAYGLDNQELLKRAREFVGKRNFDGYGLDNEDVLKRAREFVGKRKYDAYSMEKRPRQFVGKRFSSGLFSEPSDLNLDASGLGLQKRPRQFVGKRSSAFSGPFDLMHEHMKRAREFVGKRSGDGQISLDYLKRLEELSRPADFEDAEDQPFDHSEGTAEIFEKPAELENAVPAEKRPRQFVGKRAASPIAVDGDGNGFLSSNTMEGFVPGR